jgi:hypothetical protein
MSTNDVPRRILISAGVQHIPGEPNARPWTIWELFCITQLQRETRTTADSSQQELGVDVVHVLPGYDSLHDTKAWFLTDVGVREGADSAGVASLPFEAYRAAYDTTNKQWCVFQWLELSHTKSFKDFCGT